MDLCWLTWLENQQHGDIGTLKHWMEILIGEKKKKRKQMKEREKWNTVTSYIVKNGFVLSDVTGKPTTWNIGILNHWIQLNANSFIHRLCLFHHIWYILLKSFSFFLSFLCFFSFFSLFLSILLVFSHGPFLFFSFRYAEKGVNSMQILSYIVSAYSITSDPFYLKAFQFLVEKNNYAENIINAKINRPQDDNFSDDELL